MLWLSREFSGEIFIVSLLDEKVCCSTKGINRQFQEFGIHVVHVENDLGRMAKQMCDHKIFDVKMRAKRLFRNSKGFGQFEWQAEGPLVDV